jgi:hypothetical protein
VITIGIGTGLWGTRYNSFVPQWWEGVKTITRQPDSIVFVHDAQNRDYVHEQIPEQYKTITSFVEMAGEFSDFMHAMAWNQTADWYSLCGVDNKYLPGVFDQIEQADAEGCDIYIDKLKVKDSDEILEGRWIPEQIPYRMTCPGAAPIKRELFLKTGGPTKGAIYDDWELYIRCVKAGAKPFHATTFRCLYDMGRNHVTMSGVNRPPEHDQLGRSHIAKVRQELGF